MVNHMGPNHTDPRLAPQARYILPSLHVRADASTTYGPFSVGLPLLDSIWHEQVRVGLTLSMRVISLKVTCQNVALPSAGIALVNTYIPQVRVCARVSACVCVCAVRRARMIPSLLFQPYILVHRPDIPALMVKQVAGPNPKTLPVSLSALRPLKP